MIRLSRLNGKEFFLNPELIECLEATPDTLITLRGLSRYVVRESPEEVLARILEYRRKTLEHPEPSAGANRPRGIGRTMGRTP